MNATQEKLGYKGLDIPYSVNKETGKDLCIKSTEVNAVIFPCTHFEQACLIQELTNTYWVKDDDITQYKAGSIFTVDWVGFLGERKPITVELSLWMIKGAWVCFVAPSGDIFSYLLVEEWVKGHFPCQYDNNLRRAIFDPDNFHGCVQAIEEKRNQSSK